MLGHMLRQLAGGPCVWHVDLNRQPTRCMPSAVVPLNACLAKRGAENAR